MENYYSNSSFRDVIVACDIAIENHFKSLLFPSENDLKRIIYSKNDYAFRKRTNNLTSDTFTQLDLPFLNYKITEVNDGSIIRYHYPVLAKGIYIPELSRSIKYFPVRLEYECSFWCHRASDLRYANFNIQQDNFSKTVIYPAIEIDTYDLPLTAILNYQSVDFDPIYNQQDWLEKNKIHSLSMDFSLDVFLIQDNVNVSITESVILDFMSKKGDIDGDQITYEYYEEFFASYFE